MSSSINKEFDFLILFLTKLSWSIVSVLISMQTKHNVRYVSTLLVMNINTSIYISERTIIEDDYVSIAAQVYVPYTCMQLSQSYSQQ